MKAYNLDTADRNRDRVTELYLHNCGLTKIPELVYRCRHLRRLEFSNNGLKEIPVDLAKLTRLESLDLSDNQLVSVPSVSFAPSSLKELDLSGNQLSDPGDLFAHFPKLETLRLASNALRQLPDSVAQLSHLCILDLSHNQLSRLPAATGRLPELRELSLNGNRLKTLPGFLAGMAGLERLEAAGNRIGKIDAGLFERLSKLTHLHLSGNRLESLPESIGRCRMLSRLDLSRNRLAELPAVIGALPWLIELNGSRNRLTALPDAIGNAGFLRRLDLSGNALAAVPRTIANLRRLERLDLSRNRLHHIEALPANLRELDLSRNQLTALPDAVCRLPELQKLDLSHNNLKTLPAGISGAASLRSLQLTGNALTEFPGPLLMLPHLEKLSGAGSPGQRRQLLRLLQGGRKTPVPSDLLAPLFQVLNRNASALEALPLDALSRLLCFSMKEVRLAVRQHLTGSRGATLADHPLGAGAVVALVGKTHFKPPALSAQLETGGIAFLEPDELGKATHLVIGDGPETPPALREDQVFLSEADLNAFLDRAAGRYLVQATSPEQLDRLRQLLLHRDAANVRLAVQLLRSGGVPQDLLTELFAAWKLAAAGKLRSDLRRLLELYLPEPDRFVLSLRKGLNREMPEGQLRENIRLFTERTSLEEGKLWEALKTG